MDTKLDGYLAGYGSFNDWLIGRRYKMLTQFFTGKKCLEMGSSEGTGTQYLLDFFDEVTAVDGSPAAVELIKQKYPNPKLYAVCAYFEEMDFGEERFDTIVLAHILEHVDDPLPVLRQAKKFLAPGGVMIIDVPNGNSIHRLMGVHMGLMKVKTELNPSDLSIGHQRVYVPETFKADILAADLKIAEFGGMFIKVLPNGDTERTFNEAQLEALFYAGEQNPDIAAEMYIIAQ